MASLSFPHLDLQHAVQVLKSPVTEEVFVVKIACCEGLSGENLQNGMLLCVLILMLVLQDIAEGTSGYTGADLGAVVQRAALAALTDNINSTEVAAKHFQVAFVVGVMPCCPGQWWQQISFLTFCCA